MRISLIWNSGILGGGPFLIRVVRLMTVRFVGPDGWAPWDVHRRSLCLNIFVKVVLRTLWPMLLLIRR